MAANRSDTNPALVVVMNKDNHMESPKLIEEVRNLIINLTKFPTLRSLHASSWYRANATRLQKVLEAVVVDNSQGGQLTKTVVRIVSWNIEKGKKFSEILRQLQDDEQLACADVILLEEVDWGMARSGNRFVARDLAKALGMNFVFAPAVIELTKGVGDDLECPGENACGLQGNAILSRGILTTPSNIRLPQCFEPFGFEEKRYGGRNALLCRVEWNRSELTVVCSHLEVRNTPRCRARQMEHLLKCLDRITTGPAILGGDFNTNTFARGTRWRTLKSAVRILSSQDLGLLDSALHPEDREPLFRAVKRHGFEWGAANDDRPTSSTHLQSLEDIRRVPGLLLRRVRDSLERYETGLPLRLDWICLRGLQAVLSERSPLTLETFSDGGLPESVSDHRPIICDVEME
jgi:endonuclease/exonuclease/phosphatase family metal-dependent hydrolase